MSRRRRRIKKEYLYNMDLREYIKNNTEEKATPAFYFDKDAFIKRIDVVQEAFGTLPLTYSIKANPFLLECIPAKLAHVEVCSPGELKLCGRYNIKGSRIIYSGVNKGYEDVRKAAEYDNDGADIMTAESLRHAAIINDVCAKLNKKQKVILRLSSGNQFGMSEEDIFTLLGDKDSYDFLDIMGIHYFSGTQKSAAGVDKDIKHLREFLKKAKDAYDFAPNLVELGLGLKIEYYKETCEEDDMSLLVEAAEIVKAFALEYPVGIELGRFLAAPCGTYLTGVCDIKSNKGGNYAICDGGINHLVYYGQNMAMRVPQMEVIAGADKPTGADDKESEKMPYCICGSLCTVADVLVRNVELNRLYIGDVIAFYRCGAYSVTEGNALFLSRQIPRVYIYSEKEGLSLKRDFIYTDEINCAGNIV